MVHRTFFRQCIPISQREAQCAKRSNICITSNLTAAFEYFILSHYKNNQSWAIDVFSEYQATDEGSGAHNSVLKSYFLFDLFHIKTFALLSIVCQVVFDKSDTVKTPELCSFWVDNLRRIITRYKYFQDLHEMNMNSLKNLVTFFFSFLLCAPNCLHDKVYQG